MRKIEKQEIISMYEAYQALWGDKEYYAGLLRLAYISECLDLFPNIFKNEWIKKISICSIAMPVKKAIEDRVREETGKVIKILSIRHDLSFEEIALVLSIRNDVESLNRYLKNRCGIEADFSLCDVDDELVDFIKENKTRVYKVITQINRNRFFPLHVIHD
jgi:hypothetical protein